MKIDDLDIQILDVLSGDSRISMRELAKRVNLSAPSVTERVRKLESEGIIKGYTIEVDRKKLGFPLECVLEVTIKNGDYKRFKEYAAASSGVVSCVRVAGRACFFVRLSVADLQEVEAFINDVASFAATCTHVVFSEVEVSLDWSSILKR